MLLKIILSVLCIFSSVLASPQDPGKVTKEFSAYVEKYRPIYETPGAFVVVVKDGKIIFNQGFGTLAVNDKTPVDEHTVFQLASVSKNFTATLILRLATEGILSLDDKVSKYVPEFKLADETINRELSVRDLISHCIGLDDFAGDTLWHGGFTQKEVIEGFVKLKVIRSFRTQYAYSNIAFGIAGLVVERAAGKPFAEVMKEHLFIPLGMNESSVGIEGVTPKLSLIEKVKNLISSNARKIAKAHDLKDGKAYTIDFYDEFYLFPGSSGVNTTSTDMGKWLLFHLNNGKSADGTQLIREDLIQEMRQKYANGTEELLGQQFPKERVTYAYTGLGFFVYDYNGIPTFKQMGGITGARALITIVPSENLGIAIIGNLGGMRASLYPEAMTHKFLDLYYGVSDIDWGENVNKKHHEITDKIKLRLDAMRLKNPMPSGKVDAYVGKYKNPLYGEAEIIVEDKTLFLLHRGVKTKLSHLNGDQFTSKGRELKEGYGMDDICYVEFGRDSSGKAYGFVVSLMHEGDNPTFERIR